jgi:hypothetical protein
VTIGVSRISALLVLAAALGIQGMAQDVPIEIPKEEPPHSIPQVPLDSLILSSLLRNGCNGATFSFYYNVKKGKFYSSMQKTENQDGLVHFYPRGAFEGPTYQDLRFRQIFHDKKISFYLMICAGNNVYLVLPGNLVLYVPWGDVETGEFDFAKATTKLPPYQYLIMDDNTFRVPKELELLITEKTLAALKFLGIQKMPFSIGNFEYGNFIFRMYF